MFRRVIETRTRLFGEDNEEVVMARNNLATSLRSQGKYVDAANLFRSVIDSLRLFDRNHPYLGHAQHNLATCLLELRGYDEATQLLSEAIATKSERWGERHATVARSHSMLAKVEFRLGDCPSARDHCSIALDIQREKLGEDHIDLRRSEDLWQEIAATCPEVANEADG